MDKQQQPLPTIPNRLTHLGCKVSNHIEERNGGLIDYIVLEGPKDEPGPLTGQSKRAVLKCEKFSPGKNWPGK